MNDLNGPFAINNAGLVLLNSFFPMLFDRLGLIEDSQFISEGAQFKAIQCLQYVATGNTTTEEAYLLINKLLCGVDVPTPFVTEVTITGTDKELMDGLIEAAIGHWTAIGDSPIESFRGNWLVRDGLLNEE